MIIGHAITLSTSNDPDASEAAELAISLTRPANRLEAAIQLKMAHACCRYAMESEEPRDELLAASRCLLRAASILHECKGALKSIEDSIAAMAFGEYPMHTLEIMGTFIESMYDYVGADVDAITGWYWSNKRPTIH